MTQAQVFEEIRRWPPQAKWQLLETLLRDLREAGQTEPPSHLPLTSEDRLAVAQALHGSIRPTQGPVPSDAAVRDIVEAARLAKHG